MSGLCQIYPSRHVTVKFRGSADELAENIAAIVQNASKDVTTPADVDYGRIRSESYAAIANHVGVLDSRTDNYAPAMGEINFISHELRDGWMYNDIYVHVTPDEGKKTIILQKSGFESEPTKSGLDFSVETKEYRQYNSSRSVLEFDAIVLYYNLHMIDPTSHTADTQPVVIDMPLGIYVLNEPAKIKLSNDSIYGQGTAWSTRIVSRIATRETIGAASTDKNVEYATLARVLSEFGDIAETMDSLSQIHMSERRGQEAI